MPRYLPTIPIEDCYYKIRSRLVFVGSDAQLQQVDVHRRALEAWRGLDPAVQTLWHTLARGAISHRPPFAVEVDGASVVEGLLVLPVSVFIAAAFVPERYRLLAKIQLTQPGKGRNPGKLRNVLADRPCGSASVNLFIDPSIWGLNLQQYQVHARFILIDTVTGYRSQYHQQSFLIGL